MAAVYIWGEPARYENYRRAVERAGGEVRFGGESSGCDALVLPGGGDLQPWRYGQRNTASRGMEPERDAAEWELLRRFSGRPVLGICRGMQVINVFYGGTLHQDLPGHSAIGGHDRFHPVKLLPGVFKGSCGGCRAVNSAHHQGVDQLGQGLCAAAWAEDGVIEAIVHARLPVWGVQWHPERMPGDSGTGLFQAFLELCR